MPKIRTIADIRKEMGGKVESLRAIDAKDQSKAAELKTLTAEVDALLLELNAAETAERAAQELAQKDFSTLQKKAGRKFSLLKFINDIVEYRAPQGLEGDVAALGAEEHRRLGLSTSGVVLPSAFLRDASGQNYTTNADGGYLKEEMAARYVERLKERMVVAKLGAKVLGDLVGTVPVISGTAITASWLAEGAAGSVSKTAYSKATLTPHRSFVAAAVTKDLLRQTSFDVEKDLYDKLVDAHAVLLETAAINGSGSSNQPTGILNTSGIGSVVMGSTGGAITWAKTVALESAVATENALRGKLAYLTNAKVMGALKTTAKASNTAAFILDDSNPAMVNGYPIDWTNLVPSNLTKGSGQSAVSNLSAMIFGNFEDLYIGHWGGLDIVVDPYTLASTAEVKLTINAWNDVLVAQPKSFAAIVDITTS